MKMKYNRAIIITLLVALVSMLVGLAVLSRVKAQLVKASTEEYKQQQTLLASQIADTLSNNLDNIQNQLRVIATMPEVKDTANAEQCNNRLNELLLINERQLGNLGRVEPDGRFSCSVNKALIGQDTAKYGKYVHDLIDDPSHKPVLGRVTKPSGTSGLAIGLHVPVFDGDKFIGTLGGGIYFDRYQDKYLKNVKLGQKGHVVLMDDNGDILYHPSPKQSGKNLLSPEVLSTFEPQDTMRQLVKNVQAGKSGSFDYSVEGTKKIGLYKTIEVPNVTGRHWAIFITIPIEDINSAVNKAGINNIFLTLVTLVSLIIGLITFVSLRNTIKSVEVQNMKDEFISLTSHQLRTPATIVKQYLGLLMGGYSTSKKETDKFLVAAYESNETQLGIIENILSVSKIKAGHLEIQKHPLVVQEFISSIVNPIINSAVSKGHEIKVKMPTKPIKINADSTKLAMAVENLLSNAIKYTDDGGKINIAVTRRKSEVLIAVSDNGKGISKREMPALFKRFKRLGRDGIPNIPGTGLGLYLSKKIVQLHHGDIVVDSHENVGSTFTIKLPLK